MEKITKENMGKQYPIIDSFRFHYLSEKYGEELVKQKISQMIKYFNKNNLWKEDEDLYYRWFNTDIASIRTIQ